MEKNCVADFYIRLTDNATAIPLPENELVNLVRTYRSFKRDRALDVLFKLKYGTFESKKECLDWFTPKIIEYGKIVCTEDLSSKFISFTDEQFCLLADELQTQYQEKDPVFLDVHSIRGLPNGCQEELSMLQKTMADSPLLFFMAVKRCVKSRKNPDVSQWIVELLSNSPEAQTIALENLGFNFNYRIRLKSFSHEIGTLLLSMRQIYVKRQKLFNSKDTLTLPLITLLKRMIELDIQVNMYIKQDTLQKKYHHSDKVAIFESDVLKFIEVSANVSCEDPRFKTFTECRQKLESLGKAIIALLESQIEYKEIFSEDKTDSILFTAATNISLSKKMYNVERKCIESRVAYYSALESFQKFLLEHFEVR